MSTQHDAKHLAKSTKNDVKFQPKQDAKCQPNTMSNVNQIQHVKQKPLTATKPLILLNVGVVS